MSTTALVSLDEYLNTSYEPDMDFVDGVHVRRHAGYYRELRKACRIQVFTKTRLPVDSVTGRGHVPLGEGARPRLCETERYRGRLRGYRRLPLGE